MIQRRTQPPPWCLLSVLYDALADLVRATRASKGCLRRYLIVRLFQPQHLRLPLPVKRCPRPGMTMLRTNNHPRGACVWCSDDCRFQLEQLSTDVSTALDKLEGREQQLSGQFQVLLDQYRESRQQLTDMQEEFSR